MILFVPTTFKVAKRLQWDTAMRNYPWRLFHKEAWVIAEHKADLFVASGLCRSAYGLCIPSRQRITGA